jgi:translation elongation factor EF-Tu-like GTPase
MEPASDSQPLASQRAEPLEFVVTEPFWIQGRGLVLVGLLHAGTLRRGDVVMIFRPDGQSRPTTVRGIESICRTLDSPVSDEIAFLTDSPADGFVVPESRGRSA